MYLHKTADLPADRNYLMAVFPHSVLSSGAFSAFGTDCCDFGALFGLVPYLVTLRLLFFLPVVRELMIMAGLYGFKLLPSLIDFQGWSVHPRNR